MDFEQKLCYEVNNCETKYIQKKNTNIWMHCRMFRIKGIILIKVDLLSREP